MQRIELVEDVNVELINVAASDDMVAMAAWVSNDADSAERLELPGKVQGLINFLYKNNHMSPFEHGLFTFKVDVPLFVAREFHRHRAASYNEVSGRYTEMKPRFYVGSEARVQQGKMGDYYFAPGSQEQTAWYLRSKQRAAGYTWSEYQGRLDMGISKEQAREDLPLSLMTQFYVTMNPRMLMHFLSLRNEKHALKEIRDVAATMAEVFAEHMPLTYKAFVTERDSKPLVEQLKEENDRLRAEVEELQDKLAQLEGATTKPKREEYVELDFDKLIGHGCDYILPPNLAEKIKSGLKDFIPGDKNYNIKFQVPETPEDIEKAVREALGKYESKRNTRKRST